METPYFNGGRVGSYDPANRPVVKHKRAGLIQKRMYEASHKYRFYPTSAQRTYLAQTFGCVRVVYNKALEERERTYSETGKGLSYNATSALLTQWKRQPEYAWLRDVSCVPLQQTLRHLCTAYQRFFKGQAKHPRFKSKNRKQSAEFTKSGFRLVAGSVLGKPQVYLPKATDFGGDPLRIRWSRPLPSEPTTITISKDQAGRYFISFSIRVDPPRFPKTERSVGLDLGLTHAVITSEGQKIDNPRYYRTSLARLKREQKILSRKQKGSNNRRKQRLKVARLHAKIADMRRDWSHKLTTDLVRRFDLIAIESLNVKGMVKNHNLAQAISDVSWFEIKRQLRYKTLWYDKQLVEIDQWTPTSKTCSACSHRLDALPLSVREWVCPWCGAVHDRDVNASLNVLGVGLALAASGLSVRPVAALAVAGGSG